MGQANGAASTLWTRLRSLLALSPRWLAWILVLAAGLFLLFVADRVYEFLKIFDNALAILAQQNGMNRWLARALAAGFFVPVAWGAKHSFFGVWKRGLRPKIVTGAYTAV